MTERGPDPDPGYIWFDPICILSSISNPNRKCL